MFPWYFSTLKSMHNVNVDIAKSLNITNSLRQDIIDLARPGLQTAYKLTVTSRMENVYDCLLPILNRR